MLIIQADFERKLALLYLVDSILKNYKDSFKEPLESGITNAFYSAYEACPNTEEKKKLIILYHTWAPYFSGSVMSAIQTKIKFGLGEVG
jgi:hypothetical protein